jgi:mannose-6-phosphate isomerase-like protein (cupin superfamily)
MATTGRSPRRATSLARTIENPVTGDRTTFLATAEQTNGELLKYRSEVPAGSPGVPLHYHLAFTERFEVLEGRLDIRLGERENHVVLEPGQSAFVPLDTPHRFWNESAEPVIFVTEIRPARKMEQSLRAEYGWPGTGRRTRRACRPTSSSSPCSTRSPRAIWWGCRSSYRRACSERWRGSLDGGTTIPSSPSTRSLMVW